jgi:hypothetical protein
MENTNKEDGDQDGNNILGKIYRKKEKHGRKQRKEAQIRHREALPNYMSEKLTV